MSATPLIDPVAVRKFITLVHERAAAAVHGVSNARPAVLHLCSMAPDDNHINTSAFNIGDVEYMIEAALIDANCRRNVFIEPRLVRPGLPNERGKLNATLAVFASVADSDADTGKPFTAKVPASAVVETSPPANVHSWYFLNGAIGADEAKDLGELIRKNAGGDHCSGNPVQPFRLVGCPNFPNQKKLERGRIVVPTRLLCVTNKTYTAAELRIAFSESAQPTLPLAPSKAAVAVHRPAYCRSKARAILAADPADDRSAQFMQAARYAMMGGITAEEFEAMAQQHLNGCAGKYLDRLHQEVDRCYAKLGGTDTPAHDSPARHLAWHLKVTADLDLTAGALRFAAYVMHKCRETGQSRRVHVSTREAASELHISRSTAQEARDQLITRQWLIRVPNAITTTACYALGRGPVRRPTPL